MQKIDRLPLAEDVAQELDTLTERTASANDPKATAARLWRSLSRPVKDALYAVLIAMSTGMQRCMYCEDSQGTDIEHFRPKAEYPKFTFVWDNHLLACSHCNSNFKRSQFPLDEAGQPLLLDPTKDNPPEHLSLSPTTGLFVGLDAKGEATIGVCGLNRDVCALGRRDAWTVLGVLIVEYAKEKRAGKMRRAAQVLTAIRRHPFQSVRIQMIRMLHEAEEPELVIADDVLASIAEFPELADPALHVGEERAGL
jgi:uncharacterized protein (TIGR02646 family)